MYRYSGLGQTLAVLCSNFYILTFAHKGEEEKKIFGTKKASSGKRIKGGNITVIRIYLWSAEIFELADYKLRSMFVYYLKN